MTDMRRVGILLAVAALAVVVGFVVARHPADAQRPGGPGVQVFQQMRIVETYWMLLAFEMKVGNDVLDKAKPTLQAAYDKRKAVLKEAADTGNRDALNKLANLKQEVDTGLQKALGDETFNALQKAYNEQPLIGGRPGGPGGAAGGAGGAGGRGAAGG